MSGFISLFVKPSRFFIWHFFIALFMLLSALFFQYAMGLAPCELCVYQRLIFNAILIVSLFGIIIRLRSVQSFFIFLIITGYLISFYLAIHQNNIEQGLIISACKLYSIFPSWFALDIWLPWMYQPSAGCADVNWDFLGYTMSRILSVFAIFFGVWSLISFIYSFKKNPAENSKYQFDLD